MKSKTIFFVYDFNLGDKNFSLKLPYSEVKDQPTKEQTYRILRFHNIPISFFNDLNEKLSDFLYNVKLKQQDEEDDDLMNYDDVDKMADIIISKFQETHSLYSKKEGLANEAIFADVYHKLIHSNYYKKVLTMEQTLAHQMQNLLDKKNNALKILEKKCSKEMEEAIFNLGTSFTDEQVNQLAKKHIEVTELEISKWKSEVSKLREKQTGDFKQELMNLFEEWEVQKTQSNKKNIKNLTEQNQEEPSSSSLPPTKLLRQDSFTVHLGAQQKTTHNLRLVASDLLHFCRGSHLSFHASERFQTTISLYSDNLSGLVFLVDQRLNSYSGIKKNFAEVCQRSTDFHFSDLSEQLENIGSHVFKAKNQPPDSNFAKLEVGDVYITRHSNLSEVHVVFHVVTDNSVYGDINSRHAVILALRNIIKTCFKNDIKSLTIPLLLIPEITEEVSQAWCMKRAELSLKCIKGFIMEMFATSQEASSNVHFVLPQDISDETFQNIATLIPSIFRMSNPLVAKSLSS